MAISDKNNPNADFWLNLAAEHIYNSADSRTASVTALKTIILWAFGIFSVGGFVMTLFGQLKDFDQYALISFGTAFFLLTLAYYIATGAQFPKVEKFKLADPKEIANAYTATVKSQASIFKVASLFTGLGFFFLALGIVIEFGTLKKNSKQPAPASPKDVVIKTGVERKGDTTYIPTTIEWEKSRPVTLTYIKLSAIKGTKAFQETTLFNQIFYTDSLGRLFYSYTAPVKDSVQNLIVRTIVTAKVTSNTTEEKTTSVKLSLSP